MEANVATLENACKCMRTTLFFSITHLVFQNRKEAKTKICRP